ncbi:MAG: DegT/DnrJ/EryC1/StrS family aminotransferase [Fimbriimonadaceae bacterium]|nr:DegT/DnrJ/EryC1/StrS family aminotransferase [Fimbriimonadaceae bacterium]QYK55830.1 MAG: DegT/DnrJ/EryC1/StrS family aminotransferase [Fimbriimonadaceae bacterium]
MRVPFLDLTAQYREVKERVDADVAEIFATGAYVLGKHNRSLEERLAAQHGVKHGIAVNSGTDALRIMMQACGIGPGDEVVTTAFSFVATIETIVQLGAVPVMVEIDPATFNLDPNHLEEAIGPKTKAVLPIHLFGQMADMVSIREIAERHGIFVLEDSAQAVLNERDKVPTGRWGRAAALSFYVTKNLGAAGDGGMVLTDDDEVAERSRSLRIHGMGRERYYYDDIGYTSRMAELQAAVLCAKLDRLADWTARRSAIAAIYTDKIVAEGVRLPVIAPGNNHTWHQYTVMHERRDELAAYLKSHEIDSAIYYPVPLHMHEPYKKYGGGAGSLPLTEKVCRECLCLPVHPHLSDEQAEFVVQTVNAFALAPAARP